MMGISCFNAVLFVVCVSDPNISSLRVRPSTGDQEKEIRRSHTAMTFLCKHEPLLVGFVKKHIRVITLHLLAGFHPTSLANFYHVCKVLSQLVRWFPVEVHSEQQSPCLVRYLSFGSHCLVWSRAGDTCCAVARRLAFLSANVR